MPFVRSSRGLRDSIRIECSTPKVNCSSAHIYKTPPLHDAVFEILSEIVPKKVGKDGEEVVRTDTGESGMQKRGHSP